MADDAFRVMPRKPPHSPKYCKAHPSIHSIQSARPAMISTHRFTPSTRPFHTSTLAAHVKPRHTLRTHRSAPSMRWTITRWEAPRGNSPLRSGLAPPVSPAPHRRLVTKLRCWQPIKGGASAAAAPLSPIYRGAGSQSKKVPVPLPSPQRPPDGGAGSQSREVPVPLPPPHPPMRPPDGDARAAAALIACTRTKPCLAAESNAAAGHVPVAGVPGRQLPVAGVPGRQLPVAGVPGRQLAVAGVHDSASASDVAYARADS
eukprot:323298-Chlamydomonas_euryale.AAC.2